MLGAASYRTGAYADAVRQFDEYGAANRLQCFDLLFLAMAHHQLGHHQLARRYWDDADTWFQQNRAFRPVQHRHPRQPTRLGELERTDSNPGPAPGGQGTDQWAATQHGLGLAGIHCPSPLGKVGRGITTRSPGDAVPAECLRTEPPSAFAGEQVQQSQRLCQASF